MNLFNTPRRPADRSTTLREAAGATLESLENRRLMAVTASAFHSTLYVWGDANNNGISVEKSGADLVVKEYKGWSLGYQEIFRTSDAYATSVRIYGYAGADTISVNDNVTDPLTVYGGKGNDWIKGGGGESRLWGHGDWAGNPDHDPATDDNSADTIISGKGYGMHWGQGGNDTHLTDTNASGSNYDVMYGGNGNDTFHVQGHGNNAYAVGENGNDKFVQKQSATQSGVFMGGAGWDTVDFSAWTTAIYAKPDNNTWSGDRFGTKRVAIRDDVERIDGTAHADHFSGNNNTNYFVGGGGNDIMFGYGATDYLIGGDGDDTLYGHDGNDYLSGGNGSDRIYGGIGNDWLYGDAGNDSVYGEDGNDSLYGGDGGDYLSGGAGSNHLDWA